MAVMLIQIQNGEPCFFERGLTVNHLKKILFDNDDTEDFIPAIDNADLSGVDTKFEIKEGVWLLFA